MRIEPPLQWQLVRARLDPIEGSEQAGERPVLVVSTEEVNASLKVVGVLPLTSARPGRHVYSTEVLFPAGIAGQPRDSIVMAQQIRVISKQRITGKYGRLTDHAVREQVRDALKLYLDLVGSADDSDDDLLVVE